MKRRAKRQSKAFILLSLFTIIVFVSALTYTLIYKKSPRLQPKAYTTISN